MIRRPKKVNLVEENVESYNIVNTKRCLYFLKFTIGNHIDVSVVVFATKFWQTGIIFIFWFEHIYS